MVNVGQPGSASHLLQRVADGQWGTRGEAARDLLSRLQSCLQARGEEDDLEGNALRFNWELPGVRLHGCDNIAGLVVGGSEDESVAAVRSFWTAVNAPGRLVLVLAPSTSTADSARQIVSPDRCLVLGNGDLQQFLSAAAPLEIFKRRLRQQIPFLWLVPYNTTLPASPGMFYGRRSELEKLREQDDASFAVVGPSKIGKTSLLQQYRRELVSRKDSRMHLYHDVNFYDYRGGSEEDLARFIAMRIAPSSRSDKVTIVDLPQFLHVQANQADSPLEIILDEVDEVCQSKAFDVLADAMRKRLCRLIISGKGNLLRLIRSPSHILSGRLTVIRLEPLTAEEARALFVEPMRDLALEIPAPETLLERLLALTSRLPHLMHSYARRMIEAALKDGTKFLTPRHLEKVCGEFMSVVDSLAPLDDLRDPLLRAAALLILRSGPAELKVPMVQEYFQREGFAVNSAQARDICEQLVIYNILIWEQDVFRLANPAMFPNAKRQGLLDDATRKMLVSADLVSLKK